MARPALPLGTWGEVRTYPTSRGGHRATALYKDYDGVTRPVERHGRSPAQARNNLLTALRDRSQATGDSEITAETKVGVVAEKYFKELEQSDKATRTKQDYAGVWHRYLKKPLSNLAVRQMKVSVANRVLTKIRDDHGPAAAKQTRAVLTGICALMVRHDALDENPVREIESLSIRSKTPKAKRAINAGNVTEILALFHASEVAKRLDLVDVEDVLSGLGCRIGELLALDWETSVDFTEGTLWIHGTVIREKGVGLVVQPYTKSPAGMRLIRPPAWVMEILQCRYETVTSKWVFPSTTGTLRDPDNTRKAIRGIVAGTPFVGVTNPHAWRHYVSDVLHRAGVDAREIADYLGHDKVSTTQDHYLERGVVGKDAGLALSDRPLTNHVG
ncbi:site-specific integrase [Amycolatopsis sp. NPDC047767]|uniref:tyrosine-type recombinase/integrase n=1 Tax=Amycolatopsis sp. NPDC047767 TaxID=3156765 RepID=UPI0034524BAE